MEPIIDLVWRVEEIDKDAEISPLNNLSLSCGAPLPNPPPNIGLPHFPR